MSLRLTEKDCKVLEAFTAKNGVSNIPIAGIWLEEDEIDPDDDEYYEMVENYEKGGGSSAEMYYSDYRKKEVSDIRFWMTVDDAEKQKFMAAFKELNPEWKPDEDSILYDEGTLYKEFPDWVIDRIMGLGQSEATMYPQSGNSLGVPMMREVFRTIDEADIRGNPVKPVENKGIEYQSPTYNSLNFNSDSAFWVLITACSSHGENGH